jgi:hypothetical protein
MNERVEGRVKQRGQPKRELDVGAAVEVRNRFVGKWCHGFEIADHVAAGLRHSAGDGQGRVTCGDHS